MIKKNNIIAIVAVLVVAMFAFIGFSTYSQSSEVQTVTQSASLGQAPLFAKTTVNGESFSLQDNINEGKPTVVYFMASTCTKCAKNWAALNEVYPDYEDRVDFIAVSVDPTDSDAVLSDLASDKGFVFDTVAGDPNLATEYEVFKQTAKFAVDSQGNILERHDGVFTPDEWRAFFDRLV